MLQTISDKKIETFIKSEEDRQRYQLQMIPSENYVSKDVMAAVGSSVMNKYSEGQVGKRYYQGNQNIDSIEAEAKERALRLFNLDPKVWNVNVQAVTGSVANLAVYSALIEVGDKIMGMFLYDGGHLSHGWRLPSGKSISFTARAFEPNYYYADPSTGLFNYDDVAERVRKVQPKILISGGTAYPREIDYQKLALIAREVGAYYMADIAHEAGLVATGVNKSPFEYADIVTMTTRKTLRGPVGSLIFSKGEEMGKMIDTAVMPGLQGGPMNHSIAGIAVALGEAMDPAFKTYTAQVVKNAQALASALDKRGYYIVSGGTDKHLLLIDLRNKNQNGKDAAIALEKANIITNKNTVPGETGSPWTPSGVRLGTPSLTSRGMVESDMEQIAKWIHEVLTNMNDEVELARIGTEVKDFAMKFPVRGLDD